MYRILTLNKISPCGTERFGTAYSCSDCAQSPDAIMVRSAAMYGFDFSPSTLAVARAGAGVNNIPLDVCTEKGIVVFNTPGANANAVKELVVCGLLLASRRITAAVDWCKTLKGEGADVAKLVEKGKSQFVGPEICGKTLGVVGLGAIGKRVANAAKALGMRVIGYDAFLSDGLPDVELVSSIDELYAKADYITLHCPCNGDTKGMINEAVLSKMKNGVRLINFARGELVDNAAIIAALGCGKVAAYVTDFPTDEQIGVDGVVALPHLGASTPESEENCAVMAAEEIKAYLEKGEIVNSVNMPTLRLNEPKGKRVCVIYDEGASAQVAAVTQSEAVDAVTARRNGICYTVADAASEAAGEKLSSIDGVYRVRIIG